MNDLLAIRPVKSSPGSLYLTLREWAAGAAAEEPVWINSIAGFRLYAWRDGFYALPEDLAFIGLDLLGEEDAEALPSARVLSDLLRELHDLAAPGSEESFRMLIEELRSKLEAETAANLEFLIRLLSRDAAERLILVGALEGAGDLATLIERLKQAQTAKILSLLHCQKRTAAVYFPSGAYRENAGEIASQLRREGWNAFTLVGTARGDRHERGDWVFYGGHDFVREMKFVDVFIVPTLMEGLPEGSKKVLLAHDIYDSPVGDRAEFYRLLRGFDYFVLPSKFAVDLFREIIEAPGEREPRTRPLTLIPGGYVKLDRFVKYFSEHGSEEKVLVYAPTVTGLDFDDVVSLPRHGLSLLETLLNAFPDYTIIFRPHPHSLNTEAARGIVERLGDNPRFQLDANAGCYLANYSKAALMISDISGTAYTYAFATLRPVVFFSPNEPRVRERFGHLHYVKDREKVGAVVETVLDLARVVESLLGRKEELRGKIRSYRDEVIFHAGRSEEVVTNAVRKILEGESDPEWITL